MQMNQAVNFSAVLVATFFAANASAEELLYAWPPEPASFPGDKNLEAAKINYEQKKAACAKRKGQWGRFDANVEYCRTSEEEKQKKSCIADGGTWHNMGIMGIPSCKKTFSDALKQCQKNDDCLSKKCLVDPSTEKHGQCFSTDEPFGCFVFYEKNSNGTRSGGCVD